jgi:hypothetical protein
MNADHWPLSVFAETAPMGCIGCGAYPQPSQCETFNVPLRHSVKPPHVRTLDVHGSVRDGHREMAGVGTWLLTSASIAGVAEEQVLPFLWSSTATDR